MRVGGVEVLTIWCFWAFALMGQALKAIVFIVSACLCGGRRPGFAPAGDLLSCARQERRQRNAPRRLRPLRGKPASGCLRGAPHNSLRCCAAAFRQMRRVRSRSGCVLRHTRHPASTPPQAQPEGGWKPDTGHRCARPRGVQALRAAQAKPSQAKPSQAKPGRAQRWPVGMFDPRVPFRMRRGAQRPADQGSRLSERNAVKRVRARPRWTRAPQVARSEAQGRSL